MFELPPHAASASAAKIARMRFMGGSPVCRSFRMEPGEQARGLRGAGTPHPARAGADVAVARGSGVTSDLRPCRESITGVDKPYAYARAVASGLRRRARGGGLRHRPGSLATRFSRSRTGEGI